ncbi:hypothetical protein CBR_g46878 [Chara braunii]|uniref:Uncharacterized protein n=1 Tax=Chara braunii TaxID=69332 RepID=A0A388M192_CHABU|nr:hypothetical protein CBR_g46878 [Chara braunii]|eukprot:GBG88311.1 hypothetical protein CBR_g46878 [Chara braunii]
MEMTESNGTGVTQPEEMLPEGLRAALPLDPFEQLEMARRIAVLALSNRVSDVEDRLLQKDNHIKKLEVRMADLQETIKEQSERLNQALSEQVRSVE